MTGRLGMTGCALPGMTRPENVFPHPAKLGQAGGAYMPSLGMCAITIFFLLLIHDLARCCFAHDVKAGRVSELRLLPRTSAHEHVRVRIVSVIGGKLSALDLERRGAAPVVGLEHSGI